ncbi:MAG: efflux RND transporter permease subunit [Rhodospirillales bacterium]|nr:efflux RND transporter permease subunit [Alphaproteobacteria bacterium]MCB1840291.1 efflux RND transporter permease subunit [Alphaproteobacteria bacterium]MCB9976864.1 efflux RND transporter permease subunit [Rhodospirillales bacterium]
MNALIEAALGRSRLVILLLLFVLMTGVQAFYRIPKEAEPDIPIPIIYVSMHHEGISPEDAERLLVRPMEKELKGLEGLKEISAVATENFASVTLEFTAGFDPDQAIQDVREKVDIAKADLPPDTDEPRVVEVNIALFPVLSIALSGPVPERTLVKIAQDLQDKVEALPGVLKADIGGDREEMLEVVVDPTVMESYNITFQDIYSLLQNNNRLVAAGAMDTGAGRMVIKVPGVIEDAKDIFSLPIKVNGSTVVTFKDVTSLRRVYKDPESFARVNGQPALVLEVSKRVGANIIETIEAVRKVVEEEQKDWPETLKVTYMQDKSVQIRNMLSDLDNNVLSAIILVMIVMIAAMGLRPSLLVGIAIPGSFLAGIMVLFLLGYTLNIVVLFSLILVSGMLVDGAIVTIEYADRKIAEGKERAEAYAYAAKRMAWPVITSTLTTQIVFLPLLFWPGIVGEFMVYLPITVIITLFCSIIMALIFIPTLGQILGNRRIADPDSMNTLIAAESGDLSTIKGFAGRYIRLLSLLLDHPVKTLAFAIFMLVFSFTAYTMFGRGVEFFPDIEPDFVQVQVQARGDLSIYEKDALVQRVEKKLLNMDSIKYVYARTFNSVSGERNLPEDAIGIIQLEFVNWRERRPASQIIEDIRSIISDIPGIKAQVRKEDHGPSGGKPVHVEVRSNYSEKLPKAVQQVLDIMNGIGGFVDVEDSRPLPGLEWRVNINREEAARYGADVVTLGAAVQMLTTGLLVAKYTPDDADEEIDIRMRFPNDERNLDQLLQVRVPTALGHIPVKNFVQFETAQKTGTITRVDGHLAFKIEADVAKDLLVDDQVKKLKEAIKKAKNEFDPAIQIVFKGEDEDQKEAADFLSNAFNISVFMMSAIIITQFNSFYQTLLILSAIIFSTTGVLLGLLITDNPFGIVMCGIGLIALAGIVVNNNIILIDTYNEMRRKFATPKEALLRTGAQRLRPVLLTSITTVLGLMPMVFSINIDFVNQDIAIGAPSTQWWVQLSTAIAGGLTFATMLTLLLTPCMLMLGAKVSGWFANRPKKFSLLPLRRGTKT